MKIDIVTVQGSPKGIIPEDLYGRGVGGAEKSLIELAEILGKKHEITIYNDPRIPGKHGNVTYLPDNQFRSNQDRDILITFRGPQPSLNKAKGKKIGWSCDQYTNGDYKEWYANTDHMVLISPFHKNDHLRRYGAIAEKGIVIDLGSNLDEYRQDIDKVEYQCIFCSVPDRGIKQLAYVWPRLKKEIPQLKLIITSDYRLWGSDDPRDAQYKLAMAGLPDIQYVGKIDRAELVKLQLQSEIQLYPCTYPENFCISNCESQVAGAYAITPNVGALKTTNFTGYVSPNSAEYDLENFAKDVVTVLKYHFQIPFIARQRVYQNIAKRAQARFDWNVIVDKWEQLFQ